MPTERESLRGECRSLTRLKVQFDVKVAGFPDGPATFSVVCRNLIRNGGYSEGIGSWGEANAHLYQ